MQTNTPPIFNSAPLITALAKSQCQNEGFTIWKLREITYFTIEIRNSEENNNVALVIISNITHQVKPHCRRNKGNTTKKYCYTASEKKICPGRSSSQPPSFSRCLSPELEGGSCSEWRQPIDLLDSANWQHYDSTFFFASRYSKTVKNILLISFGSYVLNYNASQTRVWISSSRLQQLPLSLGSTPYCLQQTSNKP